MTSLNKTLKNFIEKHPNNEILLLDKNYHMLRTIYPWALNEKAKKYLDCTVNQYQFDDFYNTVVIDYEL